MIWSEYSFTLFFALVAGMGVWEFSANVNRHAGASVNAFISTAGAIALVFACEPMQFKHAQLRFLPPLRGHIALYPHQRTLST